VDLVARGSCDGRGVLVGNSKGSQFSFRGGPSKAASNSVSEGPKRQQKKGIQMMHFFSERDRRKPSKRGH